MIQLTRHAQQRLAQRNIPEFWIHILHEYGQQRRQDGGIVRYMDRRAAKRLRRQLTQILGRLDSLADTYLIESSTDPQVITAGYHTKRIHTR